MAANTENISIPANTWVDLYTQSGFPVGTAIAVENLSYPDIYLAVYPTQPAPNHSAFNVLQRNGGRLRNSPGDLGAWAYSSNTTGRVNVRRASSVDAQNTEGFYPVSEISRSLFPKAGFGQLSTIEDTPIAQIYSTYGLDIGQTFTLTTDSGTVSVVNNNNAFRVSTGTDPTGLAAILSKRQVKYRPGQGTKAIFSANFVNNAAGSQAGAGLISSEDAFVFGYINTTFGIIHAYHGVDEYQELTITAAPTVAENATVTINGVAYVVPLTVGTVQHTAYEIASFLQGNVPGYEIQSVGDKVTAQSSTSDLALTFAFSSGTATGSWAQIVVGVDSTPSFIPQTSWNRDTFSELVHDTGNVYRIVFQYLGYGNVEFSVYDPELSDFRVVHVLQWAGMNTIPNVSVPTFRVGWLALNYAGTTDVVLEGSSAAAFIEGKIVREGNSNSNSSVQIDVDQTLTNILTIRSRNGFQGKYNRAEIIPKLISFSSDTTKTAFIEIVLNPTFTGDMIYEYQDELSSVAQISTSKTTVSGGKSLGVFQSSDNRAEILQINDSVNSPSIILDNGDVLSIAARVTAAVASEMRATLTWVEDI